MPLFGGDDNKFNKHKLQSSLKMAISRTNLQKNRKENQLQIQRREISELLRAGKEESARIKVEGCIRESYLIESIEILQLFIDLMSQRVQLICESRICPPDMKEAASTIIWAAPRLEVPELLTVRDQLTQKFGKEFAAAAANNTEMAVNTKVYNKMSMLVPEPYFCVEYMKDIANQFNVEWSPSRGVVDPSYAIQSIQQTLPDPGLPYHIPPQAPSHPVNAPPHQLPQYQGGVAPSAPYPTVIPTQFAPPPPILPAQPTGGSQLPHSNIDFSDLEAQFAALKKGKQ